MSIKNTQQIQPSLSTAPVKLWFESLVKMGLDPNILEEKTGISRQQLEDPDGRILIKQQYKLIKTGIELTGNPNLPLYIATRINAEHMGIIGHVQMNSATLQDSGEALVRYWQLLSDGMSWELVEEEKNFRFILILRNFDASPIAMVELNLACSITMMRLLVDQEITPVEIRFKYSKPKNIQEYEQVFRAPLSFNQMENSIILSKKDTALPIPHRQGYLEKVLLQHAETLLKKLSSTPGLLHQVQQLILESISMANIDIDSISERLQMSRWTLTRKLKAEGTSFQELLQRIRQELAQSYLKTPQYSVNEVAFLLGYSESSAFQRAFKNWVGQTPTVFRRANMRT